jgi:hypothetical protein
VGFEIEPTYFEMASNRLNKIRNKQLTLDFDGF